VVSRISTALLVVVLAGLLGAGAVSTVHARECGNYPTALEYMVAELKKQDTATSGDAVMGIWWERNINDTLFCRVMRADTAAFGLWLDGLGQQTLKGASDTTFQRISAWRATVLDTVHGAYTGFRNCRELDRRVVDFFRKTEVGRDEAAYALRPEQIKRKGTFWFALWQTRDDGTWREVGPRLYGLLLAYPNEIFDVFATSPVHFYQLVANLQELCFTNYHDRNTSQLETLRQWSIKQLSSGIVKGSYGGLNDILLERLKKIKVDHID
jgi:hypothetical protein